MKDSDGIRACDECGSALVDGGTATLTARSKNFSVTVEGIPVQTCPKGHEGEYWRDRRFGAGFMDGLAEGGIMAKGKRTLTLRFRHVCPSCGGEMDGRRRTPREFALDVATDPVKARPYKVALSAPALFCARCNRHFMPYDRGMYDVYYLKLHALMEGAIKDRFR